MLTFEQNELIIKKPIIIKHEEDNTDAPTNFQSNQDESYDIDLFSNIFKSKVHKPIIIISKSENTSSFKIKFSPNQYSLTSNDLKFDNIKNKTYQSIKITTMKESTTANRIRPSKESKTRKSSCIAAINQMRKNTVNTINTSIFVFENMAEHDQKSSLINDIEKELITSQINNNPEKSQAPDDKPELKIKRKSGLLSKLFDKYDYNDLGINMKKPMSRSKLMSYQLLNELFIKSKL